MSDGTGNWYLFHSNDGSYWYRVGGPFSDQRAMELRQIQEEASQRELSEGAKPFLFAGIQFYPGDRIPIAIQGNSQELYAGTANLIYE